MPRRPWHLTKTGSASLSLDSGMTLKLALTHAAEVALDFAAVSPRTQLPLEDA